MEKDNDMDTLLGTKPDVNTEIISTETISQKVTTLSEIVEKFRQDTETIQVFLETLNQSLENLPRRLTEAINEIAAEQERISKELDTLRPLETLSLDLPGEIIFIVDELNDESANRVWWRLQELRKRLAAGEPVISFAHTPHEKKQPSPFWPLHDLLTRIRSSLW